MATQTNPHIPSFVLLPANNNRTAYRPFGLPMVLMETDRRDAAGNPINNSGVIVQNCDCDGNNTCYSTVSATSVEIGSGTKTIALASSALHYAVNDRVRIVSRSNISNWMGGRVTAYSGYN